MSEQWRRTLPEGHRPLTLSRHVFWMMPAAALHDVQHPFGGVGGRVFGSAGFKPSRKNPNLCSRCCDALPVGGAEVDLAILLADVRGSTTLAERTGCASARSRSRRSC